MSSMPLGYSATPAGVTALAAAQQVAAVILPPGSNPSGGHHADPTCVCDPACRPGSRDPCRECRADRTRQDHRRHRGRDQRRTSRRAREGHQHGHQRDDRGRVVGGRRLQRRQPSARRLSPRGVAAGLPIRQCRRHQADGGLDPAHQRDPGRRRDHRERERRRHHLDDAEPGREGDHQCLERADRSASPRGRRRDAQRVRPRRHRARGEGQRRQRRARRRSRRRVRRHPGRHLGEHQSQCRHDGDRVPDALGRSHHRVLGRDQRLQAGIRPGRRRRHHLRVEVGHQSVQGLALRFSPQRRAG